MRLHRVHWLIALGIAMSLSLAPLPLQAAGSASEIDTSAMDQQLRDSKVDIVEALKKLKSSAERAQKSANDASSSTIDSARAEVQRQIGSMRELLEKFGPNSALTQSLNKLNDWASANQARIREGDFLNDTQKREILGDWERYTRELEDSRQNYDGLARSIFGELDRAVKHDNFIAEQLLLKKGDAALLALRDMLKDMRSALDAMGIDVTRPAPRRPMS
jgi:hypothetical protein